MRKAVAQAIGEKSFLFCTFLGSLLNYRSPAMFLLRSPPLSEMSVDTFLSSLSVCRSPVSVVDLSLLIFFLPLFFSPLWMTRFPTDTVFLILTSSKPLLLILALLLSSLFTALTLSNPTNRQPRCGRIPGLQQGCGEGSSESAANCSNEYLTMSRRLPPSAKILSWIWAVRTAHGSF